MALRARKTLKEVAGRRPGDMAELQQVDDATFDAEVLDSDRPVLVDFWAEWCAPCKAIEPHLQALADEMPDKLRIVQLNIDDNQATALRFSIMSIPNMVLFVDGAEKHRLIGARPKEAITSELTPFL